MSHKRFFLGVIAICALALSAQLVLAYWIDPIGIWGAPIVHGFNHYKIKQGVYLDVCKPYEYIREKPDILYIGASKMYVGFEPICKSHPEKKVYTMGLSSLSLPDMREYLRFVYKVYKPKVIYMGLNPEDFGAKMYYGKREGYSKERLARLAGNCLEYLGQAIEDSMSLHDMYWLTVRTSWGHEKEDAPFLRGWDVQRGTADKLEPKAYYIYLWRVIDRDFKDWEYVPEAQECLRDIVNEAREAGVPLVAFFVPSSVDRYAMVELMGCGLDYQQSKHAAAEVLPIYDFAVVNELTTDRKANFYDAGHFRAPLGEKLKGCLENGNPAPYGYLLTSENVDEVFAKENAAWEKWKQENQEYVKALEVCIESGHNPEVGDFEKFIGF